MHPSMTPGKDFSRNGLEANLKQTAAKSRRRSFALSGVGDIDLRYSWRSALACQLLQLLSLPQAGETLPVPASSKGHSKIQPSTFSHSSSAIDVVAVDESALRVINADLQEKSRQVCLEVSQN